MEIKMNVPRDEVHLRVKNLEGLNFPKGDTDNKKNLASLSNEELAELSEEELEQAKRAKDNLLAIKKVDKEVKDMEDQEKWTETVQQFAQEHNLSLEEAEHLLKQRMGLDKPSSMSSLFELMKPKPSPVEEAFNKALAARMEQLLPLIFGGTPTAGNNPPPTEGAKNALSDAIQMAKSEGVQSIVLPDGTLLRIGEGKNEASTASKVLDKIDGW